MSDYPAPQGLIDLVERKYDLKVIDSHYFLVDTKFQIYSIMLNVQFNDKMKEAFNKKYKNINEANGVSWDICPKTDSVRFMSDLGNNILLLWDTLREDKENKDICSPKYYEKWYKESKKFHTVYDDGKNDCHEE